MLARDVEMFIEHCENKGLSTKTVGSYEQTLRLLILYLDGEGITQTEKITHIVIQGYIKQNSVAVGYGNANQRMPADLQTAFRSTTPPSARS